MHPEPVEEKKRQHQQGPVPLPATGPPLVCVGDYHAAAAALLPRAALGYFSAGATAETTLRENISAMNRWYILPRMLRDVSCRNMASEVLGIRLQMPIAVAPTGMQKLAHPDGECASARATGRLGALFTLSTASNSSIEQVAETAPDTLKFFQLYIYKDRALAERLVRRAEAAGYRAIVLTVDAQVVGVRQADARNRFTLPPHLKMANFETASVAAGLINNSQEGSGLNEYAKTLFDPSITWEDLKWLIRLTSLPVVVKGILTRQDARLALQVGVAAIWVSNHGGRQVDTVPPTIEALPRIVAEVSGRCPVFVDGGFTQGTEVFKALALGASLVFVGRPVLWGLACGGEEGVHHVLSIIRNELDNIMANSGCSSLQDIESSLVMRRELYSKM